MYTIVYNENFILLRKDELNPLIVYYSIQIDSFKITEKE